MFELFALRTLTLHVIRLFKKEKHISLDLVLSCRRKTNEKIKMSLSNSLNLFESLVSFFFTVNRAEPLTYNSGSIWFKVLFFM